MAIKISEQVVEFLGINGADTKVSGTPQHNLYVNGSSLFKGAITLNDGTTVLPKTTELINLGSQQLKFNTIYAKKFEGTASIANQLASSRILLQGVISGEANNTAAHNSWTINTSFETDDPNFQIPASAITGVLSLSNIPKGAQERVVVVADQAARFNLTTEQVQLGDVVRQTDTGVLYYVTDTSKLNAAAGYTEFKAGIAVSADSANKLAISHNINGTAFNGTASITTVNWGKPRLLQIGNTTKAIGGSDGAATVEFSDAYAQANQSGHTKYSYTVNQILQSGTTIATTTAWSTTRDSGIYLVYSSTADALSGTSKPVYNYNNDAAANNQGVFLNFVTKKFNTSHAYNVQFYVEADADTGTKKGILYRIKDIAETDSGNVAKWATVLDTYNTSLVSITKPADGARQTLGTLTLGGKATEIFVPYATADVAGVVSTGEQVFAGKKTFNGSVLVNDLTITNGSGSSGITFNRSSHSYITFKTGSDLCFGEGTPSLAASSMIIQKNAIIQGSSATVSLGTSATPWDAVYADTLNGALAKPLIIQTKNSSGSTTNNVSYNNATDTTVTIESTDFFPLTPYTRSSFALTTDWKDCNIAGTTVGSETATTGGGLVPGLYCVKIKVTDATSTEIYSGLMSWYDEEGNTASPDQVTLYDEILLHRSGASSADNHIYLRTVSGAQTKLQISADAAKTATSIAFQFVLLMAL